MDLTFTGRGLGVTDAVRATAEHKLAAISRLEPRAMRIELEFIAEHHPHLDGTTRVEAAVHVPRKTFRAEAEAVRRADRARSRGGATRAADPGSPGQAPEADGQAGCTRLHPPGSDADDTAGELP